MRDEEEQVRFVYEHVLHHVELSLAIFIWSFKYKGIVPQYTRFIDNSYAVYARRGVDLGLISGVGGRLYVLTPKGIALWLAVDTQESLRAAEAEVNQPIAIAWLYRVLNAEGPGAWQATTDEKIVAIMKGNSEHYEVKNLILDPDEDNV